MKTIIAVLVIFFFSFATGRVHSAELPSDYLIAVSLDSVLKNPSILSTDQSLWFSKPLALVIDDTGRAILVGRRESNVAPLTLDDVSLAARVRKVTSITEAPGISIDPPDNSGIATESKSKRMSVRYIGGIEGTRMGEVFFHTDLLLKLLGDGYESSGVNGMPNAWDLELHQKKQGGRLLDFDDVDIVRSYFFPAVIKTIKGKKILSINQIDIQVKADANDQPIDRFHTMLRNMGVSENAGKALREITHQEVITASQEKTIQKIESLVTNKKDRKRAITVVKFLKKHATPGTMRMGDLEFAQYEINDLSPDVTSFKLLTKYFDKLKAKYPVLAAYEDRLAILGLMRNAEKIGCDVKLLDLLGARDLAKVDTPNSIPVVQREVSGLGYSKGVRGGLGFLVGVKEGNSDAMRDLVLFHCPKDETVAVWIVPLTPDLNEKPYAFNRDQRVLLSALNQSATQPKTGFTTDITLENGQWKGWLNPHYPSKSIPTPGWLPDTKGDNLVELDGSFGFGTSNLLRPDQVFATPPKDIGGLTYRLSLNGVYDNRFRVGLSLPFDSKIVGVPSDPNLPDLYDINFVAGMSNPVINASYMAYSDVYASPKHCLTIDAQYITPLSLPFMEKDLAPVGIDGSILYLGPSLSVQLNKNWNLKLSAYNTSGSYKQPSQKRIRSGSRSHIVTEKTDVNESGLTFIINPSVMVSSNSSLGFQYLSAKKDQGNVSSYELSLQSRSWNDKWSKLSAGVTLYNGEKFYTWSLSMPIDFLSINKRVWF